MFRYLVIASTLLFGGSNALAQTQEEKPLSAFCDGKYSEAAHIVDEANRLYGSIYSGGSHFRTYSTDLRGTVDLYRAIQGLKPIDYNSGQNRGINSFSLSDYKPTASALTKALRLMTWADPGKSSKEFQSNIILLDVLTSRGPSDDWWLRINDFDVLAPDAEKVNYSHAQDKAEYQPMTYVTAAQRIVADMTQRHDELDWLQAALILSAYDHPWAAAGGKPSPDLAALFDHIEKKALGGGDYRAWLALLSHHKFYDREVPEELGQIQKQIASDIENCSASPEDYAALIAGNYPLSERAMTPEHLDLNLEIAARNVTFRTKRTPVFDAQYYFEISALKDQSQDKTKFALPLILSAPNVEELEKSARLNPNVSRPLLVLAGRDLENISPGAAFTRHVAMNRPSDARRVLDKAIARRPKLRDALIDVLEDDLAEDIKMIMVALRLRCLSHLISNFCTLDELAQMPRQQRDITEIYVSDGFLQRELRAWLFPENAPWSPSRYYLQNGLGESFYTPLHNRRRNLQRPHRYGVKAKTNPVAPHPALTELAVDTITELKAGRGTPSGLMALADWDELTAITSDRRLSRALSVDVIHWVQTAPSDPIMAEALHRVVRLNKFHDGGELDGKPVGKLAFELLHLKFPNSDWAKNTPNWWPVRKG